MRVIDGGAHIGFFTLLAAQELGENGTVWAFEPDAFYFEQLQRNVAFNSLGSRIHLHRVALSDRNDVGTLFLGNGNSSSLFPGPAQSKHQQAVRTTSLDTFFLSHGDALTDVHLIKLDVEGAELRALRGMRELIKRSHDVLLIVEFNPGHLLAGGGSGEEMLALFGDLGFESVRILDSSVDATFRLSRPDDLCSFLKIASRYTHVNLAVCRT